MMFTRAVRLFWVVALVSPLGSVSDGNAQQTAGQEVCAGPLSGADVFSVGEVRTSILAEANFQALNGDAWVLMDGRPLLVRTALSPHLSEESEYGLAIPDARGRFLRMANNGVCADRRRDADSDDAYNQCIAYRVSRSRSRCRSRARHLSGETALADTNTTTMTCSTPKLANSNPGGLRGYRSLEV